MGESVNNSGDLQKFFFQLIDSGKTEQREEGMRK